MDDFSNILTILKLKPDTTQKLHAAMVQELRDGMNSDLDDLMNDGSLQDSLEKLEKLYDADLTMHGDAWRPPGDVTLHLRSLDAQVIKDESDLLAKRVVEMEQENATLMKDISEKRSKVSALHDTITQTLNRTPKAIELLENRLEDLQKCITFLEQE